MDGKKSLYSNGFNMDSFKALLKFHMQRKGLNPTSLSKKARLSTTAVRDILEHESTPYPRIDTFTKLCRALNVSPHQLSSLFADLYPHDQDPFDKFHEHSEKDEHPMKEVTPELHASLNEWCEQEKNGAKSQPAKT